MSGRSAVRILPLVSTDFSHDLLGKFAPSRQPPAKRLDETLVRSRPFACAAGCAASGNAGVLVSQN